MATREKLKMDSFDRRKQLPHRKEHALGVSDDVLQRLIQAHRSGKDLKSCSKVLHGLFKGLILSPDRSDSEDNDKENYHTVHPRPDSPVLFTETDVTLPSGLDGSPGSISDRDMERARTLSHFCSSSASGVTQIFQEMTTVYEQLKTEREKQLQWEKELQEQERKLKHQEEALEKLVGLEELLHSRMISAEEKHQQEVLQLKILLREKSKENKRLKSSFETLKDLNDNMKQQLNELSEQNKRLERQSRRVQARLENLQRKYEHGVASRGCQKMKSLENVKASKKDKTTYSTGKNIIKASTSLKLLSLLLEWVLDGQFNSSSTETNVKDLGQCLPPEILLNERCLKVLPLLADQLPNTPLSESELVHNLLGLIHYALRYLDNSKQNVVLSATLRRIGEEVSTPRSHLQFKDVDPFDPCLPILDVVIAGQGKKQPLYKSPCPKTRILAFLIILRTVTEVDVLSHALDSLRSELMSEESRGLLLQCGGVSELMSVLRTGRGGLQAPIIDILMQLTQHSCYLKSFMEACSCDEFFHTASQLLKSPHLELPLLEKLSILLQKLSTIRSNRHFFESSSLHHQIQELHRKYGPTHTFLCLNLTSILHNIK